MYEQHFGFCEAPFQLTPDTAFFFASRSHTEALNVLLVAIAGGEGFIKVTGEVGTGKTLLCRKLLAGLDENHASAWLPNPMLEPDTLLSALAEELGVSAPSELGQHEQLKRLNQRLIETAEAGRRVVVCLDEVQSMPDRTLEALRLLSNLEGEKRKLMTVVLFGQPELDQRLAAHHLRQLRSRIGFSYSLSPLDPEGLRNYVSHRLQHAGSSRPATLFGRQALRCLYKGSRGIPRLVNLLAHKSLLAAFGAGDQTVGARHVLRAVRDTEDASPVSRFGLSALIARFGLVALLAGAGGVLP
jgi:MSHA biogenesis protein MshM